MHSIGENPKFYSGHSFRLGAAQQAANTNFTLEDIQELGRWRSQAFRLYFDNTLQKASLASRLASLQTLNIMLNDGYPK